MTRRSLPFAGGAAVWLCSGLLVAYPTALNDTEQLPMQTFTNPYVLPEDTGARVSASYFLRRAWVQITRDVSRTEVPPTVPLDIEAMAERPFAVAWLGHAAMLMRVNGLWVLLDPVLTSTAGPVAGFGPARLTSLPVALEGLPHIDVVLTSHDHYDHLDLPSVRHLARQEGGPPRFFVGQGLQSWFEDQVQVQAQPFGWWQTATVGTVTFRFVPAQHSSGRGPRNRNSTLWGGWVVENEVAGSLQRFYFAGDTSYVQAMFQDIRQRIGPIDLAALPIGAYQPRALMRFEHMDPDDAVRAHEDLGAARSFGVHWGTFQLGDEEPFAPARDLATVTKRRGGDQFGLVPIGAVLDVAPGSGASSILLAPSALMAASASDAQRPR
ncbi:L-ascorbate metabolism protein UlaG (beta-lactamase superfamily) [Pelomonas aquatica]|uniref:L-ascorbate metabolism protein UlaG (Beta-lactamase superfamily) n=1 Tax=Pelomonas aquatica TaxID=431058 RepID=A0ABU1ZFV9_9BURK|nr:MBL fold metallo-hydrolase [Pelomonas aquatica]MDR7299517.1 L-ascorbate metabolism protein UlaG (beta-lactamase superfamily) [Pelomonas aquatica]